MSFKKKNRLNFLGQANLGPLLGLYILQNSVLKPEVLAQDGLVRIRSCRRFEHKLMTWPSLWGQTVFSMPAGAFKMHLCFTNRRCRGHCLSLGCCHRELGPGSGWTNGLQVLSPVRILSPTQGL